MTLSDPEKLLIEHGHTTVVVGMKIQQHLDDLLEQDPIDSFDLNPHLQFKHIADQVVARLAEDSLTTTREEVLVCWLADYAFGFRIPKIIDGGAGLLEEIKSEQ